MQTTNWPKTGRNALCPCGSGRKFKRCHGSIKNAANPPTLQLPYNEWMRQALAEKNAEIYQREHQQGLGRPIISFESNGYRIVCVGMRVYYSRNWKTFHDFLRDYPAMLFGEPWMAKQRRKPPAERHPYLQWMQRPLSDHKRLATKLDAISTAPATAAISSVMSLAYNLYLIHHNLPANATTEQLCRKLVKRLKSEDHFWGALYETYAF